MSWKGQWAAVDFVPSPGDASRTVEEKLSASREARPRCEIHKNGDVRYSV